MVGGIFQYDGPVAKWLMRICDLVTLNVLTVLCCIPIFTAGASVSAMHYCTMKMSRDEEGGLLRDFFHSFRNHFGQSVALTAVYLLTGGITLLGIYIFNHVELGVWDSFKYILHVGLIIHFVLFTYAFPVFARYDNTVRNTLRNSCILAMRFPLNSIVVTLTNGLPWILCFMWPLVFQRIFFLWFFIGFALQSWWTAGLFRRVFDQVEAISETEKV